MSTILVVDDHEENLYFLQVLLKGHGFSVVTAHHGAEALALARQSPPTLVVSDLLMPVMDGFTLMRHWKVDPLLKGIPFVVYTATYVEPQDERLALDLGADAFIIKPADPTVFLARIRDVLDRAMRGELTPAAKPASDVPAVLREYNEVLIRKLEEKAEQLESTNQDLESDVARRKKVEAALRESERQMRALSRRLIETEERERRNINRELHDRVGQSLSALQLNIKLVVATLGPDQAERVGARLADSQKLLDEIMQNVRDVMADLHPPALEAYGLWPALRTYCHTFAARTGVAVELHGDVPDTRLPSVVELALFRVVQEALANVVKHAKSSRVELSLALAGGKLCVTVRDDGVGFEPGAASGERSNWGLAIMGERAQAVGASLTVQSAPGQGCTVRVEVSTEAR